MSDRCPLGYLFCCSGGLGHKIVTTPIYGNQRTSGPVNAHLTPGPGIYFFAFLHVYCKF